MKTMKEPIKIAQNFNIYYKEVGEQYNPQSNCNYFTEKAKNLT